MRHEHALERRLLPGNDLRGALPRPHVLDAGVGAENPAHADGGGVRDEAPGHAGVDEEEAVGWVPDDVGVDLDGLFAVCEARCDGFGVVTVEQAGEVGGPICFFGLELDGAGLR